jgi:hypothetical protein
VGPTGAWLGAVTRAARVEGAHGALDLAVEVRADGLGGDLARVGDRAGLAASVRLDEEVIEPEQRRAAVLLPVGDLLEARDAAREHHQARAPDEPLLVGVAGEPDDRLGHTLEHLEDDVADEARADDDVGRAARDVDALDVADEVELGRLGEELVGLGDRRRPLARLGAVGQQRHPGPRVARDRRRVGGAHEREADQVLGTDLEGRAHVEDERERVVLLTATHLRRVDGGERGAADPGDALPGARRGEHARAGVAGGDERLGAPVGDQPRGDGDRGLGLLLERLRGLLVHADLGGGVLDGDALRVVADLGQAGRDHRLVSDEDCLHVRRLEGELGHAGHDLGRGVVTSHGVDGDGDRAGARCGHRDGAKITTPLGYRRSLA